MKVAIPTNERAMDKGICKSFGRAPYFLIHDTETGDGEFIENAAASSQGGAGIKAGQTVVDSGAKVLLTPRCGENAAEVIKGADIKIYKTEGDSIPDNIEAYKGGKLSLLDEIHAGLHNNGGK